MISSRQRARSRTTTRSRAWHVVPPSASFRNGDTIVGRPPAGPPGHWEKGDLGRLVMDLSPLGIPTTANTFAVRVDGVSMTEGGIYDGDTVIIEKREHHPGDIVLAVVDNQVTLKRYLVEDGKHLLRAEHPNFKDLVLDEHSTIEGVAVGLIRRL